jgi:hypothetical protein
MISRLAWCTDQGTINEMVSRRYNISHALRLNAWIVNLIRFTAISMTGRVLLSKTIGHQDFGESL